MENCLVPSEVFRIETFMLHDFFELKNEEAFVEFFKQNKLFHFILQVKFSLFLSHKSFLRLHNHRNTKFHKFVRKMI